MYRLHNRARLRRMDLTTATFTPPAAPARTFPRMSSTRRQWGVQLWEATVVAIRSPNIKRVGRRRCGQDRVRVCWRDGLTDGGCNREREDAHHWCVVKSPVAVRDVPYAAVADWCPLTLAREPRSRSSSAPHGGSVASTAHRDLRDQHPHSCEAPSVELQQRRV